MPERVDSLRLEDWIYFKLYVGAATAGLDHLITDTLPGVLAPGGYDRWFFIRYFDEGGLHLRFRLRAHPGSAGSLSAAVEAPLLKGIELLPSLPPSSYRPMLPAAGEIPPEVLARMRTGLVLDRYEPELDKFGGSEGMPVAEAAFEVSSETAIAVLQAEQRNELSRKTVAPLLMTTAFSAFAPAVEPDRFWRDYALYWLGGDGPLAAGWRERFLAKGLELAERGVAVVAEADALPTVLGQVERWSEALEGAAGAYRALGRHDELASGALLFQFVHLMNNRLGISPGEEAFLATLLEQQAERLAGV